MSGSDRGEHTKAGLIATALVAVLGLAAYWAMFYDMGFQSGQNERKANVEAEHYASDTANQIDRECRAESGQSARECIAKIVAAERESQRGESDLAAQWKAANWVMWAGMLAGAQLLATGFGLYYIRETLGATLNAVKDTSEATEAMRVANKIAMTNASRAYLYPDTVEVSQITDHQAEITMSLKNFGNGPARDLRVFSRCYLTDNAIRKIEGYNFNKFPMPDCAPGATRRVVRMFFFPQGVPPDLIDQVMVARFDYSYTDDLGDSYSERYSYHHFGKIALGARMYLLDPEIISQRRVVFGSRDDPELFDGQVAPADD